MTVDEAVLDRLAEGISGFHGTKPFPLDWNADRVDEAIDEYTSLKDWAKREHDLHEIGEGDDRLTFTAGTVAPSDCVVKVSKSGGLAQNEEEVEVWKMLGSDARDCVAPIVEWSSDYMWVVQKRASQGAPAGSSQEVRDRLHKAGWTCHDIRADNVGVYEGRPVLMDLGVGLRKL